MLEGSSTTAFLTQRTPVDGVVPVAIDPFACSKMRVAQGKICLQTSAVQPPFLAPRTHPPSTPRTNPSPHATAVAQFSASLSPERRVGLKLWSPLGIHSTCTAGERE